jgi:hypothetical protein
MRLRWSHLFFCGLFLAAVVAANLLVNHYGPSSTPYVAFGLIAFDLSARDRLHLELDGSQRWVVLGVLIALGSALTYLLNNGASEVALASVVAFAAAMIVDSLLFILGAPLDAQRRVTVSNTGAAATDTLIFFAIAFGLSTVPFVLIFSQFTAKVAGGAIAGVLVVREHPGELYEPTEEAGPRTLREAVEQDLYGPTQSRPDLP